MNIEELVKPSVRTLKPYSSARDEFTDVGCTFLDANENPEGELNRYPDPYQTELKERIAAIKGVNSNSIFIGNGSDEIIDLLFRVFTRSGLDKVAALTPTYGMYEVSAAINEVELVAIPLNETFEIDPEEVKQALEDDSIKLLFACSPNNPTGNVLNADRLATLLTDFKGIVVIDEAYIDFSSQGSWIQRLDEFPNLVVLQTFSKALGLAGARVGMGFCSPDIIRYLNKVKPPYNVSQVNQLAAIQCLENNQKGCSNIDSLIQERNRMAGLLSSFEFIRKVFPSESNFLLIRVDEPVRLYTYLVERNIIVRNRSGLIPGCLRITMGIQEENERLLTALNQYST